MEISRVDIRGFTVLPDAESRAELLSLINFCGPGGDRDRIQLRYNFRGPVNDNFEISTEPLNGAGQSVSEVSPCGGTISNRKIFIAAEVC